MPRPPLPPVPPAVRWGSSVGALALIAAALAFPGRIAPEPSRPPVPLIPEVWIDTVLTPSEPLAENEKFAPSEKQKKPPCTEDIEVEYGGYCWMPHASKPPCKPGLIEGNGQCLVRVTKPMRPNTSVGQ